VSVFLMTYRTFTTPAVLLTTLLALYAPSTSRVCVCGVCAAACVRACVCVCVCAVVRVRVPRR
jgi:hypothetical protein